VTVSPALPAQALEIFVTPKPETPLHSADLRLPVHFLHVISFHRQDVTPAQTATLEHLSPVAGCHARAETMHTLAPPDFWLPGPFCHPY
jgi:hypothetical protein